MFNRDLNLPFHLLEKSPPTHYFPCDNFVEENLRKLQYVHRKVYANLQFAAEKQARLRDKIAKIKQFQIGQKIYLFTPSTNQNTGRAFAKKFHGPFRVIDKHSELNYTIVDINKPSKKPIRVHCDRMFAYHERRADLCLEDTSPKSLSHEMPLSIQNPPKKKCGNTQFSLYDDNINETDYTPSRYRAHPLPTLETNPRASQNINFDQQQTDGGQSPLTDNTDTLNKLRLSKVDEKSWKCERLPSHSNIQTQPPENSSLSQRLINWASGPNVPQNDKNIIDKMSDLLADKLHSANKINSCLFKPYKTRIFCRQDRI